MNRHSVGHLMFPKEKTQNLSLLILNKRKSLFDQLLALWAAFTLMPFMGLYIKQFKVAYFSSVMEQLSFQAFLQYEELQMFHTYICNLSWFTFLALIDKKIIISVGWNTSVRNKHLFRHIFQKACWVNGDQYFFSFILTLAPIVSDVADGCMKTENRTKH